MIRDEATFTVTQALDRASALNQASFEMAHLAAEQRGSTAGNLIELSAQLIQAEYYSSLNHLLQCLKAMFEDPTLARTRALAELQTPLEVAMGVANLSSGLSAESQLTLQTDSKPLEIQS